MFDLALITFIILIFLVAGVAKGIVGNGLPVISIGLLTTLMSLQEAIAIALMPSIITNLWQATRGGYFQELAKRIWPYLLMSIFAVLLGTLLLARTNSDISTIILGLLIASYAGLGVMGKEFKIPAAHENAAGPVFGFLTGLVGGMTGSPAYPGIYFLNGLGFRRNQLVQALGMAFSVVTLTIALSMKSHGLLSLSQFSWSSFAILPAMTGLIVGTKLRHKLSETNFKKYFYFSMLMLGIYLVLKSLFQLF